MTSEEKTMRRRKPKWRNIGIFAVVLLLVGFSVFVIVTSGKGDGEKICEKIVVKMEDGKSLGFVKESDVRELVLKRYPKTIGSKHSSIDAKAIEVLLMKEKEIKRAECYFMPSGDLGVRVWQRKPIMRVMMDGKDYYVDEDGKEVPLSMTYSTYVPIVTGECSKEFIKGELRGFMVYVSKDKFLSAEIQQVEVDGDRVTLVPTIGDHKILMGDLRNSEAKMKRLKSFYENGLSKIGWGDYKTISVEFDKQVVCTKE